MLHLQSADVRGDGPSIALRNSIGIAVHLSVSLGDGLHHLIGRHGQELGTEERRRPRKSMLHDDAVALAVASVTRSAVDLKSFPAAPRRQLGAGRRFAGNSVANSRPRRAP